MGSNPCYSILLMSLKKQQRMNHTGHADGVPGSWLWPGPMLAIVIKKKKKTCPVPQPYSAYLLPCTCFRGRPHRDSEPPGNQKRMMSPRNQKRMVSQKENEKVTSEGPSDPGGERQLHSFVLFSHRVSKPSPLLMHSKHTECCVE